MVIYSIVSPEDIFCNGVSSTAPKREFHRIKGGLLETSEYNGVQLVSRLYSTNPALYLDKRYSPYSVYK
ncbi:MAG: YlzJ-like family protein [Ruminiclostridium sp.]